MLKIGDFSKLSRVSIRMLLYYDDIGLLKPAETSPYTACMTALCSTSITSVRTRPRIPMSL